MKLNHFLPTSAAGLLMVGLYGCGTRDIKPDAASREGTRLSWSR
jgi:hypothetical protein